MWKKLLSYALMGLLFNLACAAFVVADPRTETSARDVERVKAGIAKLGTGPQARIEVKLRDKTKVSGYIIEAGEEGFVVMDSATGKPVSVSYPQVQQVKGNNLSSRAKMAIAIAVVAVFGILLIAFATPRK